MSPFLAIQLYNKVVALAPCLATAVDYYRVWQYLRISRRNGWHPPMPGLIKRLVLKREAKLISAREFVETGTLRGDTIWYFRHDFNRLYTIEVQPELARLASKRFQRQRNVRVISGDSAQELKSITPELEGPTLFWLDGHYSGGFTGAGRQECPIWEELRAIASRRQLVFSIAIDDAASLGRDDAYPSIVELTDYLAAEMPGHSFEMAYGIIFLRPTATVGDLIVKAESDLT
jgi:hypothetical protein